jgi:hypothetical protein
MRDIFELIAHLAQRRLDGFMRDAFDCVSDIIERRVKLPGRGTLSGNFHSQLPNFQDFL